MLDCCHCNRIVSNTANKRLPAVGTDAVEELITCHCGREKGQRGTVRSVFACTKNDVFDGECLFTLLLIRSVFLSSVDVEIFFCLRVSTMFADS